MGNGFKNNFRRKAIKKAIHNNRRVVIFPDLASVKSIGIVISESFSTEFIAKAFGPRANVHVLEFVARKRQKDEVSSSVFLNDMDFWGLPAPAKISGFIERPFDLLINFSTENVDAIEYICAKSMAKFKIASKTDSNIYDLVIFGTTDRLSLIEEIKKTLKNFNTNS